MQELCQRDKNPKNQEKSADFSFIVDWSGRHENPSGVRGWGDPTGASAPRRLPLRKAK
ncbi:MAG: hypothetical protein K0Q87_3686 [Neobacillus sp.]|nr:hypothetical protein [Neobacillus sp.]